MVRIRNILIIVILFFSFNIYADNFSIVNLYIKGGRNSSKYLYKKYIADLVYKLREIPYFRVFTEVDKIIPDDAVKVYVDFFDGNNKYKFFVNIKVKKSEKRYSIFKNSSYKNSISEFVSFIKFKYPLTGLIFKSDKNNVSVNIGLNYDVLSGDRFIVMRGDIPIAHIMVEKVFATYSIAKVTFFKQPVRVGDKIIRFSYKRLSRILKFNKCKDIKKKVLLAEDNSNKFIVKTYNNFIFIATSDSADLYNIDDDKITRLSDNGYVKLRNIEFSKNENYIGYIENNIPVVYDAVNARKLFLQYEKEKDKYCLMTVETKKYYDYLDFNTDAFSFFHNSIIFYNSENREFVEFNLINKKYLIHRIDNIDKVERVEKVFKTINNEKFIIAYFDKESKTKSILIKDLVTDKEKRIIGVSEFLVDRVELNLLYVKGTDVFTYNLYADKEKYLFKLSSDKISFFKLSPTGRYLVFAYSSNPNTFNLYDLKNKVVEYDIYKKGKVKRIDKCEWINSKEVLLFGRLKDYDKNGKIDYRDGFSLVKFNIDEKKSKKIDVKVEDMYLYSEFKNFIIYRYKDKLFLRSCNK